MRCVSRFETIGLITKHKATCGRVLTLADLLKTTFLQMCILHFLIRLIVSPLSQNMSHIIFVENAHRCCLGSTPLQVRLRML